MGGVVITAVRFSHCPQLPLCDAFLESLSKHCGHHLSHDVWRVKLSVPLNSIQLNSILQFYLSTSDVKIHHVTQKWSQGSSNV
jgi:hypothetical protein